MPPSQLKRLKASLREQGITGQQKSKKQKKNSGPGNADAQAKRHAALANIRENLNPFDVKVLARPKKFEATTGKAPSKKAAGPLGRPGVTKSFGEETRRKTLLPEIQRRHKVGGIHDRRIGESDPFMTPEERMLERFAREAQRKKGPSLFDLEDAEDDVEDELTHGGKSLQFSGRTVDDFDDESMEGGSDEDEGERRKRRREALEDRANGAAEADDDADQPDRKKSKAEVMKEVIAKSKLHKYERQQQKEDDDELREMLDGDLAGLRAALSGKPLPPPPAVSNPAANDPHMNPERAAMINEEMKVKDKEFDERVRQMALDQRAKPTDRTKTEEEMAAETAKKLQKLEDKRQRRMRGESVESSGDEAPPAEFQGDDDFMDDGEEEVDEAAEFGFSGATVSRRPVGVDDEDDFLIDGNLVANGSDVDSNLSEDSDEGEEEDDDDASASEEDDEDEEFLREVMEKEDGATKAQLASGAAETGKTQLAFTYPCPRTHGELLKVLEGVSITDTPTVIQRIRALYHPQLKAENKEKLGDFANSLVDHISHLAAQTGPLPLDALDMIIRHIHSLSRMFPEGIAIRFRHHLQNMSATTVLTPGDLVIFTAISSIYPTSDHFHQVVTPAVTIMARWLELTSPQTTKDLSTGAFVVALCVKYQRLSKRYIPEAVRFTAAALRSPLLISNSALAKPHLDNISAMTDLWSTKSAFIEIFTPTILPALTSLTPTPTASLQRLRIQLAQSRLARRPLELHHHRPLAIKTSVPKFEEGFNPDKHYDPDRERAEANKLRKEYKREHKGAMRELRKDANFVAREKLREKKEKDQAYEAKYRRLVAEIQGEEGREKNAYEREKRARKSKR